MKASTEVFLYELMWAAEAVVRPTWRNLEEGFERWAWRNGLGRRLAELERQKLIERVPAHLARRAVRVTEAGRRVALGGRDPEACWGRAWDGQWRLVIFDLPQHDKALRLRLWRHLRREHFGFLQNSLWITPHPLQTSEVLAAAGAPNVEGLVLMEAKPCGGESDAAIVAGAWDFEEINRRYQQCADLIARRSRQPNPTTRRQLAEEEPAAWKDAVSIDPLLPQSLLPAGYLGQKVWKQRRQVNAAVRPAA